MVAIFKESPIIVFFTQQNWYAYVQNAPANCVDLWGLFEVESPAEKQKRDPENIDGYVVTQTNWSIPVYLFKKEIPGIIGYQSSSDKSRNNDGEIADRGNFAPNGDQTVAPWLLGDQEKNGPIADAKTIEIYKKLFGGNIDDSGDLHTDQNSSYSTVKSRLNVIFGLSAYVIGRGKITSTSNGVYLMEGITYDKTIENLSNDDLAAIEREIEKQVSSGDLKYECTKNNH